jgi:hypothetical protein
MTYSAPQLLLVQTAQNLVLGCRSNGPVTVCRWDNLEPGSLSFELW